MEIPIICPVPSSSLVSSSLASSCSSSPTPGVAEDDPVDVDDSWVAVRRVVEARFVVKEEIADEGKAEGADDEEIREDGEDDRADVDVKVVVCVGTGIGLVTGGTVMMPLPEGGKTRVAVMIPLVGSTASSCPSHIAKALLMTASIPR